MNPHPAILRKLRFSLAMIGVMSVMAGAWSAMILFVVRPSLFSLAGATPQLARLTTGLAIVPWICVPLQAVAHMMLRRQLLVRPDVDPRVWPMSPLTKRNLHRSDVWWDRYPFIAPVITLVGFGAGCVVLALVGKRMYIPSVVTAGFVVAGMAAIIPPWDRQRVLRARRELGMCERCVYPMGDVEGQTCPECGHRNIALSEKNDPSSNR